MDAAGNNPIKLAHEPPFRQGAEGRAGDVLRVRADLLKAFDVQFDGRAYRCCGRCFDRFSDALAHARRAAGCQRALPHRHSTTLTVDWDGSAFSWPRLNQPARK
jgi:hypothetical protein